MTRTLVVEADGGSRGNPGPAGFGALVREGSRVLAERAGYVGIASNNVAEYLGLIAGLEAALSIDPHAHIEVRMDSKLVVEQMSGRWKIKHPDMRDLAVKARDLTHGASVTYGWVARADNAAADALANEAMDSKNPDIRRDFSSGADDEREPSAPVDDTPRETRKDRATALFSVEAGELVSPLTLVFVRHGVTDMTVKGTLSGSSVPGPSLNAAGRIQAAKAADAVYRIGRKTWDRVPPITRLLASPMVRTQETAAALGRRLALSIETEDRLKEIDFGQWESRLAPDIAAESGDAIHEWRFGRVPAPGGESIGQVGERMDDLIRELAAQHAQRCVEDDRDRSYALTSHAMAIKSAVGVSLGMDVSQWASMWPVPASYTIIQLRVTAHGEIAERHLLALGVPVD